MRKAFGSVKMKSVLDTNLSVDVNLFLLREKDIYIFLFVVDC